MGFTGKSLFQCGALLTIGLFVVWIMSDGVRDVWLLSRSGVITDALVGEYEGEFNVRPGERAGGGYEIHQWHNIRYDGHEAKIDLRAAYRKGTRIRVVYLVDEPEIVAHCDSGTSFLGLVWRSRDGGIALIAVVMGLGLALWAPFLLRRTDRVS